MYDDKRKQAKGYKTVISTALSTYTLTHKSVGSMLVFTVDQKMEEDEIQSSPHLLLVGKLKRCSCKGPGLDSSGAVHVGALLGLEEHR